MTITRIIVLLHTLNKRNWGFQLIRCADGKMVEGSICGGESNIKTALIFDGRKSVDDYYMTYQQVKERDLRGLPHAGCTPDDIREWVEKEMEK
jgi:hypothetical protein